MSLVVSFSIPEDKLDLKKALDKLARLEKCSRSEIIIRAIEEYIARHMKGNPLGSLYDECKPTVS